MTDNDIIKALEYCFTNDWNRTKCDKCKFYTGTTQCVEDLKSASIYLIKRQQAEIERLQKTEIEMDDFCRRLCRMRMLNGRAIASYEDLQSYVQEEKSKAVKEFVKGHKEIMRSFLDDDSEFLMKWCEYESNTDNLVKEMTGDTE